MIALEHEVIETRKAAAELIISMVEHANALGLGPNFLDFLTKKHLKFHPQPVEFSV